MNPRVKKRVEPRMETHKERQVETQMELQVESSSFLLLIIVMNEKRSNTCVVFNS